jgi:release factor glutamine methyltransferase
MIWTPKSLLDWCGPHFESKGIPSPRFDAERLLAHALGCTRLDLYLNFDKPLAEAELTRFRELVRRRGEREPAAYLLGEAGFWKLTLVVRPGCLIPRPETETLVEAILEAVRRRREGTPGTRLRVAELGTGSAAVPLAVFSDAEHLDWLAVERSAEAISVAAENRARHAELLTPRGNRLLLVRGEGFESARPDGRYDLVVSNPPYIPSAVIDSLEPEVSRWEPHAALDGGADGLRWYRYLLDFAAKHLAPGGSLLVEIGFDQAEAVSELVRAQPGLSLREVRRDLGQRPRVVWAVRAG